MTHLSVTRHTTTIQGKEITYTATAGTMAMSTELGDYDLFFTAYTRDDAEDPSERPITFAYTMIRRRRSMARNGHTAICS